MLMRGSKPRHADEGLAPHPPTDRACSPLVTPGSPYGMVDAGTDARMLYRLLTLLPLVPRGMPPSPNSPSCHVAGMLYRLLTRNDAQGVSKFNLRPLDLKDGTYVFTLQVGRRPVYPRISSISTHLHVSPRISTYLRASPHRPPLLSPSLTFSGLPCALFSCRPTMAACARPRASASSSRAARWSRSMKVGSARTSRPSTASTASSRVHARPSNSPPSHPPAPLLTSPPSHPPAPLLTARLRSSARHLHIRPLRC